MLTRLLRRLRRAAGTTRRERATRLIDQGRQAEEAGRLAEACALYREAIAATPDHVGARVNLGIALAASGDAAGAIAALEAALAIDPDDVFAGYNLAHQLYLRGDLRRAEELLQRAARLKPDFAEAHIALSNALDDLGQPAAAAEALEIALRLQPDSAGALFNYGVLLRKLSRHDEAAHALRRSLEIQPGNIDALEALSAVLREYGLTDESIEPLQVALRLAPERFDLASRELFALNSVEDVSAAELFARHRDFGVRLERAFPPRYPRFAGTADPERRLRIGYVSGNFHFHPVALFALVPLVHHDRSGFEVSCYSTDAIEDPVTQQVRRAADHWIDASALSDDGLADRIHDDAIDVLVDLAGHTGMFRLAMFARRPAPVQAAWLGYLNTTGLTRIQYRLCDARTDPPGVADALHTERLLRLPHSQWCYRPLHDIPPVADPPCARNGHVTFGSFNHASKITRRMCGRWAQLLGALPGSRLVFVGISSERKRRDLLETFAGAGIAASRIDCLPHLRFDEYARAFNTVDIALDTFPYAGGTTTLDALWMSVPVVTAPGSTPASRSAASILALLGLDDWIAPHVDAYVDVAMARARDVAAVTALRRSLRARLRASPLADQAGFTRDLEAAYRGMWREWCNASPHP